MQRSWSTKTHPWSTKTHPCTERTIREHYHVSGMYMRIHTHSTRRNRESSKHPPAFKRPPANVGCAESHSARRFITFLRKNLNLLGGSGLVKKSASLSCVLTNGTIISSFSTMSLMKKCLRATCLERP